MNIVALDPGGNTGVAMRLNGELSTCVCSKPSQVWDLLVPELDEVVYERFASSIATSHFAIYTIELCGSIQGRIYALNEFMPLLADKDEVALGHRVVLVRHEPQNRNGFIKEAKEIVHEMRRAEGKPYDKTIVHEIDAMAHLLAREALGDDVRKRDWGRGISNA